MKKKLAVAAAILTALAIGYAGAQQSKQEPRLFLKLRIEKHPRVAGGVFARVECTRGCTWTEMTLDWEGLPSEITFDELEAPHIDEELIQGRKRATSAEPDQRK